jgi:hypothetical protein
MNKKISLFVVLGLLLSLNFVSAVYYYPVPNESRPSIQIQPYTTELGLDYSNCIKNISFDYSKMINVVKMKNWHGEYYSYQDYAYERDSANFYKLSGFFVCRNKYLLWNDNTITRSNCLRLSRLYEYQYYQETNEGCDVKFVR